MAGISIGGLARNLTAGEIVAQVLYYARYLAEVRDLDKGFGMIMKVLAERGLAEDTLVIFSSDNGPARASGPTELKLMHDTATGAGYGIGARSSRSDLALQ